MAVEYVTIHGHRRAYVMVGSGPALLLLHGFPETPVMWHRVAPRLAEDFTVVCADLRGYGASGKPSPSGARFANAMRTQRAGVFNATANPMLSNLPIASGRR